VQTLNDVPVDASTTVPVDSVYKHGGKLWIKGTQAASYDEAVRLTRFGDKGFTTPLAEHPDLGVPLVEHPSDNLAKLGYLEVIAV